MQLMIEMIETVTNDWNDWNCNQGLKSLMLSACNQGLKWLRLYSKIEMIETVTEMRESRSILCVIE